MTRWVLGMVVSVCAAAALTLAPGCGSSSDPAKPAAELREFRLGYFANLTHAQALLGVASGDFDKAVAPAKLVTRVFNAGPSLIEALMAGEIDMGYVGPGPTINAFAKTHGQGIRVVAGAVSDGVVIVVGPDSGITRLEDLKGKRIATPQLGNTQDISARHYIKTLTGADPDNMVPIANAEQASLMSRKQIDAAWAPEPWGARLVAEAGGKILAEERDLWPSKTFGLTVLVTTPKFLADHPEVVKKVLALNRGWTTKLAAEPAKYVPDLVTALATLTGKKLSEKIIADAITRIRFDDEPSDETFKAFAQWSYDLKFLKDPPKLDGLVDTTLLKELGATKPTPPAAAH
jgi:NitT/TauT family transport system substrate-binding protein